MKRGLLILLAIVLALPLAALAAAHVLLSDDALRTRAEAAVLRATGRQLTIAGPIRLRWSLTPTIEARDVSLANPPGFSRPAMAHVGLVEAQIGLLPLLSHRIALDHLRLSAPDILFERGADGRPNWLFTAEAPPPAAPAAAPATPRRRYAITLGDLTIARARLGYRLPGMAAPIELFAPHFRYDSADNHVLGELALRGASFQLSGTAGPLAGASWPIDLRLAGPGLSLGLSGTSAAAGLAVTVPDLAALSPLAGRPLPKLRDVSLAASLSPAGLSGLELRAASGTLAGLTLQSLAATTAALTAPVDLHGALSLGGQTVALSGQLGAPATLLGGAPVPLTLHLASDDAVLDASGTLTPAMAATLHLTGRSGDLARLQPGLPALRDLQFTADATLSPANLTLNPLSLTSAQGDLAGTLALSFGARPALRGALRSTHLALDPPSPPPPAPAAPPLATPTPAPPPDTRLIPDRAIPFAALTGADADLQFDIGSLDWHGRRFGGVAAHAVLQGGVLRVDPAGVRLGDKTLTLHLQANAAVQTLALQLAGTGLPAGPALALLGVPEASGTLDLRADLKGQGPSWRAQAATLSGHAGLAMVDGEIDNAWLLDKLQGALRAANLPIAVGGDSRVRCAALRVDAASGKLLLQVLTLDTTKLALEGRGTIDLANETLDLHLRPTLRLGAALSVPVQIGGTLRDPKPKLEPGAIAPGRIGIILGGAAPAESCGPALTLARDGQAGPMPNGGPTPPPAKPADLLRRLLR